MTHSPCPSRQLHDLIEREWLEVNHLGGYACSTVASLNTRKYHGLLVAAMAPPVRRMVILSRVEEMVCTRGREDQLDCCEYPGVIHPQGYQLLRGFGHEPYPRWAYQGDGWTIEKSLRLIHGQNTVCLTYTLLAGDQPVDLKLRPLLALRGIHELAYQWNGRLQAQQRGRRSRVWHIPATSRTPEAFFAHDGEFYPRPDWYLASIYRREQQRGYAGLEDLWTPGQVCWTLSPGQSVHFVCSTDPIELEATIEQAHRQYADAHEATIGVADPVREQLSRACEKCIASFTEAGEAEPTPMVISGFPWSVPSIREALMGFGGLFLATGRRREGLRFLQWAAAKIVRGLTPSELPEDGSVPLYRSADTSLWLIHAVHQYLRYSGDAASVQRTLLQPLIGIIHDYRAGTALGLGIDSDGLLSSRAPGMGTTWMDAQIGDWVITPRQGRPVELNALWYNALRAVCEMCEDPEHRIWCEGLPELAESARRSFNRRFWNEHVNCCFDVVADGGVDPSIRPNQLLAISLPFAVLDESRWPAVLQAVERHLLTPVGLRSLAPGEPCYQGRYSGDVVSRDRAQHNGSVFPWLLGHYVTAAVRTYGGESTIRRRLLQCLQPSIEHLTQRGLGALPELFDGDAPHAPGGAIASARSAAELLRCYSEELERLTLRAAIEKQQQPT